VPAKTSQIDFMLRTLVEMSPWFWVSAIYGVQTMGAIAVTFCFKVRGQDVLLPIALLGWGTVSTAFLGYRDRLKALTPSICWLPLAVYALFIFSLSHRTFSGAELSFKADYFHLVEFFTLALFLSCFWQTLLRNAGPLRLFFCVVVSGLLYGLADEFHQAYIPGRDSNPVDILWDVAGLSAGCGAYLLGRRTHKHLAARIHKRSGEAGRQAPGFESVQRRGLPKRTEP
jgi:VanZ family protein